MSVPSSIAVSSGPLRVKAYRGDGCVLLAMDLPQENCAGLAGFAIERGAQGKPLVYTENRLGFSLAAKHSIQTPRRTRSFVGWTILPTRTRTPTRIRCRRSISF